MNGLRKALAPEVDNTYTKLDTSDRVLYKEWVGLTPTEFNSIKDNATTIGYAITKTEAMLKEKNGG